MAEAVVDGAPITRFFCHKCSVEIERLLPDYKCPYCTSGFIEQLQGGSEDGNEELQSDSSSYLFDDNMDVSSESYVDFDDQMDDRRTSDSLRTDFPQESVSTGNSSQLHGWEYVGPTRQILRLPRQRLDGNHLYRERVRHRGPHRPLQQVEMLIENFILNLSGFGLHLPAGQGGEQGPPVMFLGNPGDYVWGRDGFDTIVTQLLNQMDGSGPPPLPRKQIDEIPTITVSQLQIDIKLQCSVCWEDYLLDEVVRQLPCKHVYHTNCIEPWLLLHGTCPICRQSLGDQSSAEANRDTVGPSLAALFRAANQTTNNRRPSASSSPDSTSSSANSTTQG